jgi:peptide subunit release factor 1 (eRF1)
VPPADWGVLLVRKGGFAVARLHGTEITASKVGKRHVQGKTKAGGWSQQRFARRRDNQARAAMAAADEHAARILDHLDGPLIYGGVEDARPEDTVLLPGHVPDPRREVLNKAIADAQAALFSVINAEDR